MSQRKKPHYSLEFKRDAAQLIISKGYTYPEATSYEWRNFKRLADDKQLKLIDKIQDVFAKSRQTYGSRRLVKELAIAGYHVGRYQVRSLMKKLNFKVRYPKRFKMCDS